MIKGLRSGYVRPANYQFLFDEQLQEETLQDKPH